MKDGRTHLAHKTENAVDLETGVVVAVTMQPANSGDTTTMIETLITAAEQVEAVLPESEGIQEVVGDKGYHSTERILDMKRIGLRTYISEPKQGRRRWRGDEEARDAVYSNRRRIRGERGKELLRRRGERLERPFAHLYETGGMRRTHLRGRTNILKRILIHVSALNLGIVMRAAVGFGTPRALQGRIRTLVAALNRIIFAVAEPRGAIRGFFSLLIRIFVSFRPAAGYCWAIVPIRTSATGCYGQRYNGKGDQSEGNL